MSEGLAFAHSESPSGERRKHPRRRLRSLAYAELDQENGGIVLDASERGISVHAVIALTDELLPRLRLRLPDSIMWLETRARVVWTLDSGKVAGLQFEDLSESARDNIREWLSMEATGSESEGLYPSVPPERPLVVDLEFEAVAKGNGPVNASPVATREPKRSSAEQARDSAKSSETSELRSASANAGESRRSPVAVAGRLASADRPPGVISKANKLLLPSPQIQISQPKLLREEPRHTTSIYLLLLLLAIASLTSGWAAGRGEFRPVLARFQKLLATSDASGSVATPQDHQLPPPVNDIEVVDLSGQRRTISLLAEPSPRANAASAIGESTGAAEPDDKQALNFQVWTLSPPQRSIASRVSSAVQSNAPPAVGVPKGALDIGPLAPGAIEPASPDALPKPENMVGVLKRGALIRRVEPDYPEIAKQQNVSGTVTLQVTVDRDGAVRDVRVISGPKLLIQSAVNAVKQWRYAPTLLDGKAFESKVEISLVFHLPNGSL